MGTDKGYLQAGFGGFHHLRQPDIAGKPGGRGEDDHELVFGGEADRLLRAEPMGGSIQKPAVPDQTGRIGEPCGVPEGRDFVRGREARARAAIEFLKRGRIQKQGLHSVRLFFGILRLTSSIIDSDPKPGESFFISFFGSKPMTADTRNTFF
jgi:hypothetical protein